MHCPAGYRVLKLIGNGSFASVWKAVRESDGLHVAIKLINMERSPPKLRAQFEKEAELMLSLRGHPNIVTLFDIVRVPDSMHLIMEYCNSKDLGLWIDEAGGRLDVGFIRNVMKQLALGLRRLHEVNMVHRDLKPQNLLLHKTQQSQILVKIADFGFAKRLYEQPDDGGNMAKTLCGTPMYMAPEIYMRKAYNAKADLWSVGTILFHLVTGKPPFFGLQEHQMFNMSGFQITFPRPDLWDPQCLDLCRKLLVRDPVQRISFEEFFSHPFLSMAEVPESSAPIGKVIPRAMPETSTNTLAALEPGSLNTIVAVEYVMVSRQTSLNPAVNEAPVNLPPAVNTSQNNDIKKRKVDAPRYPAKVKHETRPRTRTSGPLGSLAILVQDLAKKKIMSGYLIEALSLQRASLSLWKQALTVNLHGGMANVQDPIIVDHYKTALEYGNYILSRVKAENQLVRMKVGLPSANSMVFEAARTAAIEGGIDEFLGDKYMASLNYARSLALLHVLLMPDSPLAPEASVDVDRLNLYFKRISERYDACRKPSGCDELEEARAANALASRMSALLARNRGQRRGLDQRGETNSSPKSAFVR